ncbi:MAG TPA: phosphohistidine phosphatase SixA [Verrucomicrobiae bacterium]|nr:phosphohistidine phosphatase SixA [Verrucomicrobiae bacterium]
MDLFILRHGIAEDQSASGADRDRVLTAEGREKIALAGQALRKLNFEFDSVLSSPYLRAWQTAEIIVEAMGNQRLLQPSEALSSGLPLAGVLAEIKKSAGNHSSLLLVGHEPDLSRLISMLLSGSPNLGITMKKGSLAKLSCLSPEPGNARLEWLLTPKQLCRLA